MPTKSLFLAPYILLLSSYNIFAWVSSMSRLQTNQSQFLPVTRLGSTIIQEESFGEHEHFFLSPIGEALNKIKLLPNADFAATFNKRRGRCVEVRPSSIPGAGLGLFTTEKIKAGTIVAFYPTHIIGVDLGDSSVRFSLGANGLPFKLAEEDQWDESYLHHLLGQRPLMHADMKEGFGDNTLFVDVDPALPDNAPWVSHRINDGAVVHENSEQGVLEYYKASRLAKNCVSVPFGPSPLLATITTRKLKSGEELFTTYGCSFFLGPLLSATGEEETEMTEEIRGEAKSVAQDIFSGMQAAAIRNANEVNAIQMFFDA